MVLAGMSESFTINLDTVSEIAVGATSSAGIRVNQDGTYESGASGATHDPVYSDVAADNWIDDQNASVGDDFHCRLVTISGTLDEGTADQWDALTSDREYVSYEDSGFVGTLQISEDAGSTILKTSSVTLDASSA